jgi:hypothetical protein
MLLIACSLPSALAQNSPVTPPINSQSNVNAVLSAADNSIKEAFNAMIAAENAGANTTTLTVQINQAANLLAQAYNANATSDLETATNNAQNATSIAQTVLADAQNQQQLAASSEETIEIVTITVSVVCIAVFVLALWLVWRRFKTNYLRNLAQARPEVQSNAA